ncbi:CARDB domain-containing protein [Caproicibacter fermentans]|uniref:CARDB domain-containing protein n=1 Tax=Caproicibacter fermentans TaxID=2576756 RepID=A0A7G8T7Y9_9FIRM|nr:CARDB domain-containing protein [Caproicibacter fermentans]QNK39730.1 hypothetical protein HCR03_13485 [Caproicibacter fermentans]
MKRSKMFFSVFLTVAVLAIIQPVYAASPNRNSANPNMKSAVKVLSIDESEPMAISDIINQKKAMLNTKDSDSGNDIIKGAKLTENKQVKDSIMSPNASGPDLAIGSITTNPSTQPFSYTNYTKFSVPVANIGDTSDTNVTIATLIDGETAWIDNFGTFASGYGGIYTVSISKLCGSHRIDIEIEGDTTETNSSNNKSGRNYTWQSVIDLAAIAPTQVEDPLICTEEFHVKAPVVNYGDISVTGVRVDFYLPGGVTANTTVDLPAKTGRILTLTLTYYACGGGQFSVEVDKNKNINDVDRSNNYTTKQFYITPEEDAVIGRYQDPIKLKFAIAPSAQDLTVLSYSDISSAINKWNGIISTVKIDFVANVGNETPDDYNVVLNAYPGDSQDFIAETDAMIINGQWIDTGLRRMKLNSYYFNGNDSTIGKKELIRTVAHETGHIYGLDHPTCQSQAIMFQSAYLDSGLASYNIELHDSANLKYLYS